MADERKPKPHKDGNPECYHEYRGPIWCDFETDVLECRKCGQTKEVTCNFDEEYV